jgi:hypothetical protein
VLGTHPHVLPLVAQRGRRLVADSLGNFVFFPGGARERKTGILETGLARSGATSWRMRAAEIVGTQPRISRVRLPIDVTRAVWRHSRVVVGTVDLDDLGFDGAVGASREAVSDRR